MWKQNFLVTYSRSSSEFPPGLPAPVKEVLCACCGAGILNLSVSKWKQILVWSDLRIGWQDAPCWNFNYIIQFVPVNTFTAVRSVSCIYLAGITLEPDPCGPQLSTVIKWSAAVAEGAGVMWEPLSSLSTRLGLLTLPLNSWAEALCFGWRPSV